MYLNIASYLYGKQIKSKMGNKLYLKWMIFICVRLNWLDIHECHTMPLNNRYQSISVEVLFKVPFEHRTYLSVHMMHIKHVLAVCCCNTYINCARIWNMCIYMRQRGESKGNFSEEPTCTRKTFQRAHTQGLGKCIIFFHSKRIMSNKYLKSTIYETQNWTVL